MQNQPEHTFHFLSEISKEQTYRQLFPDPKAGLAVIWLYERVQNGTFEKSSFTERDIHQALKEVNPSIEQDKSRHPKEHYNLIIAELLEYFLRYDEERQTYSFKEYAIDFCRHAHKILEASFSPTRIEKICFSLRGKLETCDNFEKLSDWFKLDFDAFKPHLKSQLDYLDRQIDQSVNSFRANKKLSFREGSALETLKQIDERFETIREQNRELRSAFREIEQIRQLMEKYGAIHDNDNLANWVHRAVTFFHEMRRTLTLIDKRLDRIQPKIRQVFNNLNKPLFDARVEQFIYFIIENSIEGKEGTKKVTHLPGMIPEVLLYKRQTVFKIVERKDDLFPPQPLKRLRIVETTEGKAKAFASFHLRLEQQDEISKWITTIQQELEGIEQVSLASYFFRIMRPDVLSSISLAIAVIYRAVVFFERHDGYTISIDPGTTIQHNDFKTYLWEVTIRKKR